MKASLNGMEKALLKVHTHMPLPNLKVLSRFQVDVLSHFYRLSII